LKPVAKEAVERELENLRHPLTNNEPVYVQTFGNFEIFINGTPPKFKYSKTKELLAYLVDRKGAMANMREICSVLWESEQDSENQKSYLRKLISDMTKTLKEVGADDIILKQFNSVSVVPDKIICDSYGFMNGEPKYINAYTGQYMAQYSWAEMTEWNKEKGG
jgi:two-component SAPR family response regulator